MCCLTEYVKAALRHKIAIYMYNTTTAFKKIKMSFLLHHVITQSCLTAGELKDCLGVTLMQRMNCRGTAWFFHFLFSEILGCKARLHTPAGCCLGESPQPSFFWWNQRKSTSSPRRTTHPSLSSPPPLLLLHYSIILSDRPSLWALAPLLIPISERQRGPLVCRHASSNWIIPEIWESAQKGICN